MGKRTPATINNQQPRVSARDARRLGNQLPRQVVVVLVKFAHRRQRFWGIRRRRLVAGPRLSIRLDSHGAPGGRQHGEEQHRLDYHRSGCRRGRTLSGRTGHPAGPRRVPTGRLQPRAAPPAGGDSLVKSLETAGIDLHFLDGRRNWQFFPIVHRLERLLRQQNAQLTQTFLFHANIVGRIAARRAGVARVVCGIRVAQRGSRWRLWLDRKTDSLVDRHVCVSQGVSQFSADRGGLPKAKLAVIPNGVDLARFERPKREESGHGVVTYVGRLDRQKGLSWLLDTATVWLRELPDCELLIVGEGPERGPLEAKCRSLGLSDRVHFALWRLDIPQILASSRLLVLPSLWEGMPNAVLEAMAAGLPVVVTDVEGVRDILGPTAGGQVIPLGDVQAFADRIICLVRDPQAAAAIGEANRRRVAESFTLEAMVEAYQSLWRSLLAGC